MSQTVSLDCRQESIGAGDTASPVGFTARLQDMSHHLALLDLRERVLHRAPRRGKLGSFLLDWSKYAVLPRRLRGLKVFVGMLDEEDVFQLQLCLGLALTLDRLQATSFFAPRLGACFDPKFPRFFETR